MTYTIVAHTNDVAKLIVSETRTTDKVIAELVERDLRARGYHVTIREED